MKKFFAFIVSPKRNQFVYLIVLAYLGLLSGYLLWHRMWFSPDHFFLAGIVAAMFLGGTLQFLKDWVPFILLFLGYESMRGLAPILNSNVHIYELINADKWLFGYIPTIRLQEILYRPGSPQWYDFLAILFYTLHFVVPFTSAFFFWLVNKKFFKEFTVALIILSFAGFITYVLYPAMPPWMASERGYIPHLVKVMDATVVYKGQSLALPTIYKLFRGNEVAAMPSLHAAYALLVFLFFVRYYKKRGLLLLPYVLGVWFSVVYLGEHYVIDVIFGALYAALIFALVVNKELIFSKLASLNPLSYRPKRLT
ncbi:MAG: hypothetical protein A3F35_03110 [Candidatus Woykebacteria bacterium RIFCSPHIGHO2_12_FULL_45_10]|uniref:Phosphatidic acid phosphatase type 2/haloperoxidase domain-containing protein n=1 Tax=Candidatus Woykebacteria bacterium RIFCSPHIGHO2_12_FULL_45_10 TaxID=1802603 RepID=A0A1G1WP89_9BACT|nr:MAG: hypothetical protein A3F35_03110 [Candidatus Woykebacteria bacterium RIFCSPHIGHO2_12_FULL_45_10]